MFSTPSQRQRFTCVLNLSHMGKHGLYNLNSTIFHYCREILLTIHIQILSFYRSNHRSSEIYKCTLCHRFHSIRFCYKFLNMSVQERKRVVRDGQYCANCLAKSHTIRSCKSKNTCSKCKNHHHTLLHTVHPNVQPPAHNRRQKSKPQLKRKNVNQKNLNQPDVPNHQILSEAIRSLASVLCATSQPVAQVQGRRHV